MRREGAEHRFLLELDSVTHQYPGPPAVTALQSVSLGVGPGEFVAIMGPSGSGKSTMLNVLGLLTTPFDGRYLVDGVDTVGMSGREKDHLRASFFGFVFQSSHCIPTRTAVANVALSLACSRVPFRRRGHLVQEALRTVGMLHRAEALCGDLSGGERQRVAIARALAGRPAVLLADEPTGNLDPANTERVIDILHAINGTGVTVVVITHDPVVAATAPRELRLEGGVAVPEART